MDELRLALVICGVALLGAIYLWESRRRRRARALLDEPRLGPFESDPSHEQVGEDRWDRSDGPITVHATRRPVPSGALDERERDEGPATAQYRVSAASVDSDPGDGSERLSVSEASLAVPPTPGRAREPNAGPRAVVASGASESTARQSGGTVFGLRSLAGLKAQRETPEQLELAGLELTAAPRAAKVRKRQRRGAAPAESQPAKDFVLALTIMAPEGRRFRGGELQRALEHEGLRYGAYQAFHRDPEEQAAAANPLFSVVNVVQPGSFDLETIDELMTPGIALFTRVPGPPDSSAAFNEMLSTAERLARSLGGRLCDETRSTLTTQSVNLMRERIAEHGRRLLLKA